MTKVLLGVVLGFILRGMADDLQAIRRPRV